MFCRFSTFARCNVYTGPTTTSSTPATALTITNTRHRKADSPIYPIPQEVRSASLSPHGTLTTPTKHPCANCTGDHLTSDCTNTKCGVCDANFTTSDQDKFHYYTYHRHENRPLQHPQIYQPPGHTTPPTQSCWAKIKRIRSMNEKRIQIDLIINMIK